MIDVTSGEADEQLAAKKKKRALQNDTTEMAAHVLAFEDSTHHGMIINSMTPAYPGGVSWNATTALQKKHQPNDKMGMVKINHELQDILMRAKEDPQELFNQLEMMMNKHINGLVSLMSDDTHMSKIIGTMPENCKGTVARFMQDKQEAMPVEGLEDTILAQCRVSSKKNKGS